MVPSRMGPEPVKCGACGAVVMPALPSSDAPEDPMNATQICHVNAQELLSATQKATPTVPAPVAAALRFLNPKTSGLKEPERQAKLAESFRALSEFITLNMDLPARQWDVGWAFATRARVLLAMGRGEEMCGDLLEGYARRAELSSQEILELARACVVRKVESPPALALYKKFLPYLLEHSPEYPGGEAALWEFLVRVTSDISGPGQEERAELCSALVECRPDSSVAQFLIGLRLHLGARQQEALNFLRRSEERMQEDRSLPIAWKGRIVQTLGRVQVALGRHEEARNAFERSLSHDPSQYEAYRDYVLLEVHLLRKVAPEDLAHPRHRARLDRARRNLEAAEKNLARVSESLGAEVVASQRVKLSKAGSEIERMLGGA